MCVQIFDMATAIQGGRGKDLAVGLVAFHMLSDVRDVFNPTLPTEDIEGIRLSAQVAASFLNETFDLSAFGASLMRGKWTTAMEVGEKVGAKLATTRERIFGAALGLLFAPSCFVDAFALGVVHGFTEDNGTTARAASENPLVNLLPHIERDPTRGGLLKSVSYGSLLWSQDPSMFSADFHNPVERTRFERYQKVLEFVASNPRAYSDVMTIVEREDWKAANELAAKVLGGVIKYGGTSVDDPPPLADFLLLAVTPDLVSSPAFQGHVTKSMVA